jgi:hypothetical protein
MANVKKNERQLEPTTNKENNEKQRNSEQLAHCNTWKGSPVLHGGDMAIEVK